MKLGQILRETRVSMDKTITEIAIKLEVHKTYISDIERGNRNISDYNMFCKWIHILGLEDRKKELFYKLCEERGNIEFIYIKEMG